ncbi:YkvA family protein [Patescibacteria group bacterium]|jgi:uncharacterized membrane protein YkvA (DUF1232 family)|nr:YkvA family protein [Patescibacteria group bacterium]
MTRHRFIPNLPGIWAYLRDSKTNWKPKALAVLSLVYLLWPVDLVPDLAPVLGWLDDIGFVGIAAWYLGHATNQYLNAKEKGPPRLE